MGRYEVTNEQYRRFKPGHKSSILARDKGPAAGISWDRATAYADWLSSQGNGSFRLPTEAEWEYAARSGGRNEKYAGGNDVDRVASYIETSPGYMPRDVGDKAPNGLGLYDMSGNVWEWCQDVHSRSAYAKHSRNNPVYTWGWNSRVLRGGSFKDKSYKVRAANRRYEVPSCGDKNIGFRLVRAE